MQLEQSESNNPYLDIFESTDEGIIIIQDEMIVQHNQAALRMSGYPEDQYRNTHIDKIIHPDDVPSVMDYHRKRLAGEHSNPFIEGRYIHFSGDIRWMQVNSSLIKWNGIPSIVSFISDITDRKFSEAKFTAAFQAAGSIIIISDMDNGVLENVNNSFIATTGFLPSEVVGKNPVDIDLVSFEQYQQIQENLKLRGSLTDFEIELKCKDGTLKNCLYSGEIVTFENTQSLVSIIVDITERKIQQDEIRKLALTDPLSGLANRIALTNRFNEYLKIAQRESRSIALMLIDLDKFKSVNDCYGHKAGDEVIIKVAEILQKDRREIDIVARLGGDEFAIVFAFTDDRKSLKKIAYNLIEKIKLPFVANGNNIQIGASIGIALYPEDGKTLEIIYQKADSALYKSKHQGRNTANFHS